MAGVTTNADRDRASALVRKILGCHHEAVEMGFDSTASMLEIVVNTLARDTAEALEARRVEAF